MKLYTTLFRNTIDHDTDTIAVVTNKKSYRYEELIDIFNGAVTFMTEHGVNKGDRILLIPDHDLDAIIMIAVASALCLQVIMPYNLNNASSIEWKNLIESAKPDHVIYCKKQGLFDHYSVTYFRPTHYYNKLSINPHNHNPMNDELVDNFFILFTSGTTGKPKAISISEELIVKRVLSVSEKLNFRSDSNIFLSGLMNNTTGIIFSFGSLYHRAKLHIPSTRVVEDWPELIEQWKISHIMLRPVSLDKFLTSALTKHTNLSSIKTFAYGAASISIRLLERARSLIHCDWIQGYGLSETFGPFCWLTEQDHRKNLPQKYHYCVGKPDGTLQVDIDPATIDEDGIGEIIVKGSALMSGYHSSLTKEIDPVIDWFHTGDLGYITPENYLVLKGRKVSSVLSANGHRIFPEEIESIFLNMPDISQAVLIVMKHDDHMQGVPVLCFTGSLVKQTDSEIKNVIRDRLSGLLSEEKWPDYLFAYAEPFKVSENDKIVKSEISALVQESGLIYLSN